MTDTTHPHSSPVEGRTEEVKLEPGWLSRDAQRAVDKVAEWKGHSTHTPDQRGLSEGERHLIDIVRYTGQLCGGFPDESMKRQLALLAIIDRLTASHAAEGRVPERETWWLVERRVQPPQYCVEKYTELPSLTADPWRAARFATEREAFDYRLRLSSLRDECKETEHVFINRTDSATAETNHTGRGVDGLTP